MDYDIPDELKEEIDIGCGFPIKCSCGAADLKLINTEKDLKNFLRNHFVPLECSRCGDFICLNLLPYYIDR